MLNTEKTIQISDYKIYNSKVKDRIKLTTLGDLHISPLVDDKKLESIIR